MNTDSRPTGTGNASGLSGLRVFRLSEIYEYRSPHPPQPRGQRTGMRRGRVTNHRQPPGRRNAQSEMNDNGTIEPDRTVQQLSAHVSRA